MYFNTSVKFTLQRPIVHMASTVNLIISTVLKTKNILIYSKIRLCFYMFEVKYPEDNLKIETCRSISGFMKKCTYSTCGFVGIMY